MENLPGDVLRNIFIRLLAKQLAQMRSVSKSWNALLSESSFIKSHLHRSIHNNDQIVLFFSHGYYFHRRPLTACRTRSPDHKLTNFIKLPVNPSSEFPRGRIIGSVNGLICFSYSCRSYRDYVVHIWNPSLSAVLTLPRWSWPSSVYKSIEIHFRFGFDHAFSQSTCNMIPYGFILRNNFIFKVDKDHFDLYDPIANKGKTFKMTGAGVVIKVVEYVDSLVWVW